MLTPEEIKKMTALRAADLIEPGMTIGIGTGTTARWLIEALSEKVKAGLSIRAVPTSKQTAELATIHHIPLLTLNEADHIDCTIDGADEIDPQLQLIKGGGGALLQEKMVAAASRKLIIIADQSKLVSRLGTFPLPVEVIPYGWKPVSQRVESTFGITAGLRMKNGTPFITDHGHFILDCHFGAIADAAALNTALHNIPGVVETGLFIGMAQVALIGYPDGKVIPLQLAE